MKRNITGLCMSYMSDVHQDLLCDFPYSCTDSSRHYPFTLGTGLLWDKSRHDPLPRGKGILTMRGWREPPLYNRTLSSFIRRNTMTGSNYGGTAPMLIWGRSVRNPNNRLGQILGFLKPCNKTWWSSDSNGCGDDGKEDAGHAAIAPWQCCALMPQVRGIGR